MQSMQHWLQGQQMQANSVINISTKTDVRTMKLIIIFLYSSQLFVVPEIQFKQQITLCTTIKINIKDVVCFNETPIKMRSKEVKIRNYRSPYDLQDNLQNPYRIVGYKPNIRKM